MWMQKRSQGNLHGKQASRAEAEKKTIYQSFFLLLLLIVLNFGLLLYIVVINTGSQYLAGPNAKILGGEEILTYTK